MSKKKSGPDRIDENGNFRAAYVTQLRELGIVGTMTEDKAKALLSVPREQGRPNQAEQFRRDAARVFLGQGPKFDLTPKPEKAPSARKGTGRKTFLVKGPLNIPAGEVVRVEAFTPPTATTSESSETTDVSEVSETEISESITA